MAASKVPIKKVCEHCQKVFYAYKRTTRFCCSKCNERHYKQTMRLQMVEEVENRTNEQIKTRQNHGDINTKDYLTVTQSSELLGISRWTLYRLIGQQAIKASRITGRTSLISRESINAFLNEHPFNAERKSTTPTSVKDEYYSTKEIMEKYKVSDGWIFKFAKKQGIPKITTGKDTYWSKKHVDLYFRKKEPNPEIVDWYTVSEIMEKFGYTSVDTVYGLVNTYSIPRKKIGKNVLYSKIHVDKAKGLNPDYDSYYTVKDIVTKYGVSRDIVYRQTTYHNVSSLKAGRNVYYPKKDIEVIFGTMQQ